MQQQQNERNKVGKQIRKGWEKAEASNREEKGNNSLEEQEPKQEGKRGDWG